jgi:hypothetical protein
MLMERNAEIIRGWPYDGALDRAEVISAGATLQNGDWVAKQSDNSVNKSGATASNAVGLVFVGNGDSASATNSNKAVVLWGNFIANVANYDNTATYAPGNFVTAKNGILTLAVETNTPPDPIVGTVLDVVAAVSGGANPQTAHLVVAVK